MTDFFIIIVNKNIFKILGVKIMAENKYKDELPYKEVEGEKIFFRGTYRIVGQIVQTLNDIKPLGYLIMDDKRGNIKAFDVAQTLFLIRKFKFINAEESKKEPGVIRCTEGKMDNLMKFNSQLKRISEPKIMILGEIVPKKVNEERIFKILNADLQIMPRFYKESEIIELVNMYPYRGFDSISNAKKSINNTIIANVSPDIERDAEDVGFPKILKEEVSEKSKAFQGKAEKTFEWRKKKHREKLVKLAPLVLLRALNDNRLSGRMINTHIRYPENAHHIKDDLKIIVKEIYSKEIKTPEVISEIKEQSRGIVEITSESYPTMEDFNKYIGVYQYMLYIPSVKREVLKQGKNYLDKVWAWKQSVVFDRSIYNNMQKKGLICKAYKDVVKELEKYLVSAKAANEKKKDNKKEYLVTYGEAKKLLRVLPTTTFKSAKEIAELGFAVHEKYGGNKYKTSYGANVTLKYIGSYIPNYEKYYKMSSSFGDLACLANIESIINKQGVNSKEGKNKIEIIMGILSIYRPDIAKIYMRDRLSKIQGLEDILPNVDFDTPMDYGLNPALKVYYDSGFNAFYMDSNFFGKGNKLRYNHSWYGNVSKGFRYIDKQFEVVYEHDKKEPLINYRFKFGLDIPVNHTMMTELVAILGLLTSDDCLTEDIERYIGCLRNI